MPEESGLNPLDLHGLEQRVAELQTTVDQVQQSMQSLSQILHHPAVHLNMERLDVQHLVFHFDTIHVDDLGGELNIGFTQMFKPNLGPVPEADNSPPAGGATIKGARVKEARVNSPPCGNNRPPDQGPRRSTLPGSVITRWLRDGPPSKQPSPTKPDARAEEPPCLSSTDPPAANQPRMWPIWPPEEVP